MSPNMKAAISCIVVLIAMHGATAAVTAAPAPANATGTTKPAAAATTTTTANATAKAAAAVPGKAPLDPDAAAAAAADAEARKAAESIEVDLSSIPKLGPVGPVTTTGGSTAVGDVAATKGTKKSDATVVPLTGFDPVWPSDKATNKNQVLVDVVTDSPIDTIKSNQIPFIQSLAEALAVDTKQVYWYNLTKSDLNIAYFLVDTNSPEAKKAVLGSLASPDNTAKFYANAAAYTLNILNGPEVAPQDLDLGTDVISTPDHYTAYNGDTGLISNNATAAGSNARMVGEGSAVGFLSVVLSFAAAVGMSLAVLV